MYVCVLACVCVCVCVQKPELNSTVVHCIQKYDVQEYVDNKDPNYSERLIKVTNEVQNISTFWTIDKLRSKLEEMKDFYQVCRGS